MRGCFWYISPISCNKGCVRGSSSDIWLKHLKTATDWLMGYRQHWLMLQFVIMKFCISLYTAYILDDTPSHLPPIRGKNKQKKPAFSVQKTDEKNKINVGSPDLSL